MDDYASLEDCIEDGIFWDLEAGAWRFGLWAENLPAIDLYLRVQTQWRVGLGGSVGLDYNVLFHELDRAALARDDYDDLFDAVRVIERAVLSID